MEFVLEIEGSHTGYATQAEVETAETKLMDVLEEIGLEARVTVIQRKQAYDDAGTPYEGVVVKVMKSEGNWKERKEPKEPKPE